MIINMNATATTQQSTKYALTLSTSSDANVIISKDSNNFVGVTNSNGLIVFNNLETGIWTVNISKGSLSITKDIDIQEDTISNITLNSVPEFTYKTSSGANAKYEIYNANDVNITNNPETQGNWKIKFLESGILTINRLNSAADGIDVFCVGGGGGGSNGGDLGQEPGGGGGSGRTTTGSGITVSAGTSYYITIGSGGGNKAYWDAVSQAGKTSAFGVTAEGGYSAHGVAGGNGGSGGSSAHAGPGGTDGKDGSSYGGNFTAGEGQHSTTREFGESNGALYASGGAGGRNGNENGVSAQANTGDGGSGGDKSGNGGSGGSGIVIIRNKR